MQGGRHVCYHSELFHGVVLDYPTYDKELFVIVQASEEVEALPLGKRDYHTHRSSSPSVSTESEQDATGEALQVVRFLATISFID
jgi:hypothetical protein